MKICNGEKQHIPGILKLLQQVGQVHHQGRPDLFCPGAQKYDAPQMEEILQDENTPVFVAEEDGQVLGYGFCQLKKHEGPVFTDYLELYIDDICVEETCRGQQIGKNIYGHIYEYAKSRNCHNITLNVWSFNEGAYRFYEKCGMKPQRIFMEKLLENDDAEQK